MSEKRNRKKKNKNGFFLKIALVIIVIISIVGVVITYQKSNDNTVAGKIVDGKVEFVDKISTASKASTNVVEIKSIKPEVLDTVIITDEKLDKVKNNDAEYTMALKDYMKKNDISNRDLYNIQKAIQRKIVNEEDNLIQFFYKVTGFKNEKEFIKFCENAFELLEQG